MYLFISTYELQCKPSRKEIVTLPYYLSIMNMNHVIHNFHVVILNSSIFFLHKNY